MAGLKPFQLKVQQFLGFDLLGVLGTSSLPQLVKFLRHLASAELMTWEMFRTITAMLECSKETWALLPEAERRFFTDAIWATNRSGDEYEAWIYAVCLMTMKNTVTAFKSDSRIYSSMDEAKAIVDYEASLLDLRYDKPTCANLFEVFFSDPDSANRAVTRVGLKSFAYALSALPPALWVPRLGLVLSAQARSELASLLRNPGERPSAIQRGIGKDALFHAFFGQRTKGGEPTLPQVFASVFALSDRAFAECVAAFGPVVLANLLKEDRACLLAWKKELRRLPGALALVVGGVIEHDFRIRKIRTEEETQRLARIVAIQHYRPEVNIL